MFFRRFSFVFFLVFLAGCLGIGEIGSRSVSDFNIDKVEFDEDVYPVVILGGGVGGLTSAIYMSQANIKTLVLEGDKPGGALAQSHSVRNWPGDIDIAGADIVEKIKKSAISSGAKIVQQKAVGVDFSVWPYEIETQEIGSNETKTIKALSCIIAMGATPNFLNVPGEQKYWGKGVTNCAICDGALYKNRVVGVVGGGDAAIEEVNYLSGLAKNVYVFVRRDEFRATGKVKEEVLSRPNVEVVLNSKVSKIDGNGKKLTHVILSNSILRQAPRFAKASQGMQDERGGREVKLDGLFLAIGSKPNSSILKDQIDLDSKGYVVLFDDQQTSKNGIYSVGDISDPKYKQAISSAGDGCVAALQAQSFLAEIGYDPAKYEREKKLIKTQKETKTEKEIEKPKKIQPKKRNEEKIQVVEVIEISGEAQFEEEVLESDVPVVVDFHAVWCGPCKLLSPILKKVAEQFKGEIKFVKIDVDQNLSLARKYNVMGMPTLMFFKDGQEVNSDVGYKSATQLTELVQNSFDLEK